MASESVEFFRAFLRSPSTVGSVIPSSRVLADHILSAGRIERARTIVELGPGTGPITRHILKAMNRDARLFALEIDERLVDHLRDSISDSRFTVENTSAREIRGVLAKAGRPSADLIISGIPFSTLPHDEATAILREIRDSLAPSGRFVAYQFRRHIEELARPILGDPETRFEWRNIPPVRIFSWSRTDVVAGPW